MKLLGILVVLAGFALAVGGLFITQGNTGRAILALAGIGVSLVGILGILNTHFLSNAIWKS